MLRNVLSQEIPFCGSRYNGSQIRRPIDGTVISVLDLMHLYDCRLDLVCGKPIFVQRCTKELFEEFHGTTASDITIAGWITSDLSASDGYTF